jgi:hypothetical protein
VPSALGQDEHLQQIDPSQLRVLSHDSAVKGLSKGLTIGLPERDALPLIVQSLPTWSYSIEAYDGKTYTGQIVGRSPFLRGKLTTE